MRARQMGFGVIALFVLWNVMDFVIHGVILAGAYASAPGVFREMADMRMPLLYAAVLVGALGFTGLYSLSAPRQRLADSLLFGLWFGVATAFGMGFATYAIIPIPLAIAWGWCLGSLAESLAAATALHFIFRPRGSSP
jgi:hypothetical protein